MKALILGGNRGGNRHSSENESERASESKYRVLAEFTTAQGRQRLERASFSS
jgi:hypothetical protein